MHINAITFTMGTKLKGTLTAFNCYNSHLNIKSLFFIFILYWTVTWILAGILQIRLCKVDNYKSVIKRCVKINYTIQSDKWYKTLKHAGNNDCSQSYFLRRKHSDQRILLMISRKKKMFIVFVNEENKVSYNINGN